jgi:predicted aconitase with swiveling domain
MVIKGTSVSRQGIVVGEAMVTDSLIAFWGGIDWRTGEIVEVHHPIKGQNVKDKVLVFPAGKGGAGDTFGYYYLYRNGKSPKALLCNQAQPTTVAGAILCKTPMVYGFRENIVELIGDGDLLKVNSDLGEVEIIRKHDQLK